MSAAMHNCVNNRAPPFAWNYYHNEVLADGIVHIIGVVMAICGSTILIMIAGYTGNIARLTAVTIYLGGFLSMLGFSAVYNLWPVSPLKWRLRRLDQSAIFLLIAATYTAFMLPMYGAAPTVALVVVWSAAVVGITMAFLSPDRLDRASVAPYFATGASGIFAIGPMTTALAPLALFLIASGAVLYSVGVVFHLWNGLRFQNAIWHSFVLTAATCHYAAVLTEVFK